MGLSEPRFQCALMAVREAGDLLSKSFRTVRTGKKKRDGTMVSDADIGAEKVLIKALLSAFPRDGILSEESEEVTGKSGYRWILDPLDGTHNFLGGIPLFGSLAALEKEGVIIAGFCYFPIGGELFFAERGSGAFLNGKKISVSPYRRLNGGIFLSDANSRQNATELMKEVPSFHGASARIRFLGSASFSFTRVAMGFAEAALMKKGKPWDIAAPALIVEEAGGQVTDFKGESWNVNSEKLLATNVHIHQKALQFLRTR